MALNPVSDRVSPQRIATTSLKIHLLAMLTVDASGSLLFQKREVGLHAVPETSGVSWWMGPEIKYIYL